jgi:hypothetical protein
MDRELMRIALPPLLALGLVLALTRPLDAQLSVDAPTGQDLGGTAPTPASAPSPQP